MIIIFATEPQLVRRAGVALHDVGQVTLVTEWSRFNELHRTARCTIVADPWISLGELTPKVAALRDGAPFVPLVVVTGSVHDQGHDDRELFRDSLVGLHAFERRLRRVVCRALVRAWFIRVGQRIRATTTVPSALGHALSIACDEPRDAASIGMLATRVGCDRSTLWHQWRRIVPDDGLRLEDFLGWLLLVRGTGLRAAGDSWPVVATELGVHHHTLARLARRLTDVTLREIAGQPTSWVVDQLRSRALSRITDVAQDMPSTFWN
ncbi:MAG TPA: hypothetical protein VN706_24510 [Gemmatimonadaceae bacterium]|nr:hypothetical protein [Gemmatimonadaceae bacterium]